MPVFTALATKVYKNPLTVVWANSIKQNEDYLFTGACRAWINFDSSAATLTSRNSFNISSLTDSGVGKYTISFTTGFVTTDYVVFVQGRSTNDNAGVIGGAREIQTGLARIITEQNDGTEIDIDAVMVAVFGVSNP